MQKIILFTFLSGINSIFFGMNKYSNTSKILKRMKKQEMKEFMMLTKKKNIAFIYNSPSKRKQFTLATLSVKEEYSPINWNIKDYVTIFKELKKNNKIPKDIAIEDLGLKIILHPSNCSSNTDENIKFFEKNIRPYTKGEFFPFYWSFPKNLFTGDKHFKKMNDFKKEMVSLLFLYKIAKCNIQKLKKQVKNNKTAISVLKHMEDHNYFPNGKWKKKTKKKYLSCEHTV